MSSQEVAYLGPEGTYSHLVAEKRFGAGRRLVPLPTIQEVCLFVAEKSSRRGIVPIENSSGGAIYETVDILMANHPPVCVVEEISLNVRLALLGHKGEKIKTLYSHFAPLEHCTTWLGRNLPHVERHVVNSTAMAAQMASGDRHSAAIGSRRSATLWGLDVIEYPLQADVPNITVFLAIGGRRTLQPSSSKISLAVKLLNQPGALCTFLETFRNEGVNLSRLISRPIRGCPGQYAFMVDVEGSPMQPHVKWAMGHARKASSELRIIGAYPLHEPFTS
jgi:chorismate mutase / prephenate dehydratase